MRGRLVRGFETYAVARRTLYRRQRDLDDPRVESIEMWVRMHILCCEHHRLKLVCAQREQLSNAQPIQRLGYGLSDHQKCDGDDVLL